MRTIKFIFPLVFALMFFASLASAQLALTGNSEKSEDLSGLLDKPLNEAEATALMSRLSDEQVREVLLHQMALQSAASDGDAEAEVSDFVYHATTGAVRSITVPVDGCPYCSKSRVRPFQTSLTVSDGTG